MISELGGGRGVDGTGGRVNEEEEGPGITGGETKARLYTPDL